MGSKLFAAFGAGALLATGLFYLGNRPHAAEPPPLFVSSAVSPTTPIPAATPDPEPIVATPPKPDTPAPVAPVAVQPKPKAVKTSAKKSLRPVGAVSTAAPATPAAPASVLSDAELPAVPQTVVNLPPVEVKQPPVEVASTPVVSNEPVAPPPPPEPKTVSIKSGTLLQVRLAERLDSNRSETGDTFYATLDQPLVVDGWVVAERGSRLLGRLAEVDRGGRVQGVAHMSLELTSLTTADGQKIPLRTASFVRKADNSHKDDATKVGAGAAIGAIIGAIAGGGKGAAIGAGAGGAAGAGTVAATRGQAAVLDTETRLSFRLENPLTITERQ